MQVPFTWKVKGWFTTGWSSKFAVGDVKALKYFGEDLSAYPTRPTARTSWEGHRKHLGARIGHSGTVVNDCVQCPFHGWRWAKLPATI